MSFDISIIDIALLIAVTVLFALYLNNTPRVSPTQKPASKKNRMLKKVSTIRRDQPETKENTFDEKSDCPHYFGYLSKRQEKGVPQECAGCARLVKCMLPEE